METWQLTDSSRFRLLVRDRVGSTNDTARQLAETGEAEGLVILAHQQTAGRGRRGAPWFSPPGESLAFSIIVRPTAPKHHWPRLALAAGVSVAKAIESFGLPAQIKWPNDVWIQGRKVAGILVETGPDFAIVGIGINVNSPALPAEVAAIATSMQIEAARSFSRPQVLAAVLDHFGEQQSQIGENFSALLATFREYCCITGKRVSLLVSGEAKTGLVTGISENGELVFLTDSGLEYIIQADEIRPL